MLHPCGVLFTTKVIVWFFTITHTVYYRPEWAYIHIRVYILLQPAHHLIQRGLSGEGGTPSVKPNTLYSVSAYECVSVFLFVCATMIHQTLELTRQWSLCIIHHTIVVYVQRACQGKYSHKSHAVRTPAPLCIDNTSQYQSLANYPWTTQTASQKS